MDQISHVRSEMLAPMTFWKSDELLMKDVGKEMLVSYNIHKKEF